MEAAWPTLGQLRKAVARFSRLPRPDESYRKFTEATSPEVDLSNAMHRARLHEWLNAWGCRIRYPRVGEASPFDDSLEAWWRSWGSRLPGADSHLSMLVGSEIEAIAAAFGDLSARPATTGSKGRTRYGRRVGPTASAKALF